MVIAYTCFASTCTPAVDAYYHYNPQFKKQIEIAERKIKNTMPDKSAAIIAAAHILSGNEILVSKKGKYSSFLKLKESEITLTFRFPF